MVNGTQKKNVADPSTVPAIAGQGAQSAALVLTEEVAELNTLMKVSHELQKSGMFPQLSNAGQMLAIILAGRERGYSSMTSLMNIHIVNGRPGFSGALIAAELKRASVDFDVMETDETHCVINFRRQGKPDFVYKWTLEEARRAKKIPAKPDSVWATYPQDMLYWRCLTAGARKFAPDAIMGLHMEDELTDNKEIPAAFETEPSTRPLDAADMSAGDPATHQGYEKVDKATGEVIPAKEPEADAKPDAPEAEPPPEAAAEDEGKPEPDKTEIETLMEKTRTELLVEATNLVVELETSGIKADTTAYRHKMVVKNVLGSATLDHIKNNNGHLARFIIATRELIQIAGSDGSSAKPKKGAAF